jgi:hypothetical protein
MSLDLRIAFTSVFWRAWWTDRFGPAITLFSLNRC